LFGFLALLFEQQQFIIGHKYTTQVIIDESILPGAGGRPQHRVARSVNSSKHVVFKKHFLS
jgi:hypothetical protein